MIRTILAGSRIIVGLAVISTFLGSVVLLVAATIAVARTIWGERATWFEHRFWADPKPHDGIPTAANHVDHLGVQFIQITDIVLLGIVMYIVSLGLYQLFFDQQLPLPGWLRVHTLMELKRDLISVTVVLLGVTFLGEVVDWDKEDSNIFYLGAGVALVIAALGIILWLSPGHASRNSGEGKDEAAGE